MRNASSRKVSGPFSRSAKGQRTGPAGMQGMRYDMAGAAAALAAVAALARCGITDGVRAVFPLVENLPTRGLSNRVTSCARMTVLESGSSTPTSKGE